MNNKLNNTPFMSFFSRTIFDVFCNSNKLLQCLRWYESNSMVKRIFVVFLINVYPNEVMKVLISKHIKPDWNMKIYCSASIVALFNGYLCRALYNFSETPWPVSWKYVMSRYRWNFLYSLYYCWNTDLSRYSQYFSFITYLYFYTCIWFDIQWEKTWRKVNQTWKKLSNHYFRIICNVKKGMRSKSEPKFEFILFLNIWVLYQRMWFMHNCLTITI